MLAMIKNHLTTNGDSKIISDGIAILGNELVKYADLNAKMLINKGLARGQRVVLIAEYNAYWLIIYFAIISTGAAIVPIDSSLSKKELNDKISYANPTFIITSALANNDDQNYIHVDANFDKPMDSKMNYLYLKVKPHIYCLMMIV